MQKNVYLFLLLLLGLHSVAKAQDTGDVIFKNGDRVNFIGNSITHGGEFHNFIMLYYATRFPDAKVKFINSGIWGDNANNFLRRMNEDILRQPADYSIVMAGMNDVNRGLYAASRQSEPDIETRKQRALDDYRGYLERVIQRLQEANTKVILQKPSIYDQTGDLPAENMYGVNDALQKCTVIIDELAQQYNLKVVDYFSIMNQLNQQVQAANPKATIVSNDRIHPGTPGNFIMAYQFLKDTGAPRFVAGIELENGTLKRSKDCSVTEVKATAEAIEFKYLAKSLPFPVVPEAESALQLVPFSQELNAELLKVAKLASGDYALTIDGSFIRNYSSDELAKGVNLALEKNTPQYKQAVRVRAQTTLYRSLQRKLRDIKRVEINYLPAELKTAPFADVKAYIDHLKATNAAVYTANKSLFDSYLVEKPKEQETETQLSSVADYIYTINKPKQHVFRISKGAQTDPNANNTHSWHFDEPVINNLVEGWAIVNYTNAHTADGILNLTAPQTYNHIRYNVPAANAVDPAKSKTAVIRLKNSTGNGNARFYWWSTNATAAYLDFEISANDTEFKEYKIDLSRDPRWSGNISIIRFDVPSPLHATFFGKQVQVDEIKLTTEVLPEPEPLPLEPMPAKSPAPFGVNLSGAEFGSNIPGVFNTDYTYPNAAELTYFKNKGFDLVRLPFKWERIQPQLNGPLDPVELGRMRTFIKAARERGVWILLDMHNYGRRKINNVEYIIGDPALSIASVADAWEKLALEFKNDENIWGYGIMNEPHDMLASTPWFNIAQAIITKIRTVDAQTTIVVGGDSWSSPVRWPVASANLKDLVDPSDNLIFEAHVYFDDDASGKYDQTYDGEGANPNIGITRSMPFVKWLRDNNLRGFMGEYGVPDDDPRWLVALDNMLAFLRDNRVNGTYWAAGPWWHTYKLAVEPIGGADRPQLAVLEKYKVANTEYAGDLEPNPSAETHVWDFNGTVSTNRIDGWVIVNYTGATAADGILSLPVSNVNNNIRYDVPASNAINPVVSKYAIIRLKNETPDAKARFYWWGPVGDNVANFVEFDIVPNDTGMREYLVDLSQNTSWTGKSSIRIIRFDVPAAASTGALGKIVRVDQVKLLSALPQVFAYNWHFDAPVVSNRVEGWNIINYTNAATANGVLSLTANQTYHNIRYDVPASSPVDPKIYQYATIRLKNETNDTQARFYFWGPVGDNTANLVEFNISANDTGFKEYTIDLSQHAIWKSKSSIRIIRFDVPGLTSSNSFGKQVYIDHIGLSSHQGQSMTSVATAAATVAPLVAKGEKNQLLVTAATANSLQLTATLSEEAQGLLVITDMLGRKLTEKDCSFTKGQNAVVVPVQQLATGLYVATFYSTRGKISRKFLLQH